MVEKTKQLIQNLLLLVKRFPHFPVNNASYNRNFVELITNLYSLKEDHPEIVKKLHVEESLRVGLSYRKHDNCQYDRDRLHSLKAALKSDYELVQAFFHSSGFRNVADDIAALKKSDDFDTLAKKLVRISLLLYGAEGRPCKPVSLLMTYFITRGIFRVCTLILFRPIWQAFSVPCPTRKDLATCTAMYAM